MWRAVFDGWDPPHVVPEEVYRRVKEKRDPRDPLTAFCGFGLSFGAKWFGGYARNHKSGTDYAGNARKSVLLKAKMLRGLAFDLRCCDYREIAPTGATVYFDPPYFGRSSYAIHGRSSDAPSSQAGSVYGLGGFCHASFWAHARDLVRKGNTVLVTEFTAPEDWVPVWSWGDTVVRHRDAAEQRGSVEERIFTHRDQAIHDLL
jgi:DNA adenine methylase